MGESPERKGMNRRGVLGALAAAAVLPAGSGAEAKEQVALHVERAFPKSTEAFVDDLGQWFGKHPDFTPQDLMQLETVGELRNALTWYINAFCEERGINVWDENTAISAQALGYALMRSMKVGSDERLQNFLYLQWNTAMDSAVEHSLHPERSELRGSFDPNEREA